VIFQTLLSCDPSRASPLLPSSPLSASSASVRFPSHMVQLHPLGPHLLSACVCGYGGALAATAVSSPIAPTKLSNRVEDGSTVVSHHMQVLRHQIAHHRCLALSMATKESHASASTMHQAEDFLIQLICSWDFGLLQASLNQ
jgi:hypothetical protein